MLIVSDPKKHPNKNLRLCQALKKIPKLDPWLTNFVNDGEVEGMICTFRFHVESES